ncbi:Ran-binding protein 9 [Entomortierella lignicola]|nr:Ran-binding protein 9 [Entomortierella lignicola]
MSSSDHPSDSLPNDSDSNNTTPLSSTALTSPRITTVAAAPADSAIASPTTSLRTTIGADSDQPATSPPTTSSIDTDIPVVNPQQDLLSSIRENAGNPPSTVAISTATATWPSSSSPNRFHTSLSLTSPSRQFPQFPLRSSQLANRQLHLPLPEREDSSRPRAITFGTLKKASMSHRIPSFSTEKKSKMTTLPSYLQCTTFKQYFQPEGGIEHVSGLTPIEREPSKRRRLLVESSRRRHMHHHDSDTSSGDGSSTSGSSSGSDSSYENDSSVSIKMERRSCRYQIPTKWSSVAKTDKTELSEDDLQCGVYYFEVLIKSKGKQGYIGIGVCNATVDLNRLPGWEPQSWGYHGDDGNSFEGCGNGRPFGPVFTTGDVIGCGVNFRDMTLFFTKNGVHLGVAFRNLKGTLYPTVGMRTVGEVVEANFGQREFVFNIENYVRNEKVEAWQTLESSIQTAVVEKKQLGNISQSLSDLVLSYMVHHGYTESAKQLSYDLALQSSQSQIDNKTVPDKDKNQIDSTKDLPLLIDSERRKGKS